MLNTWIRRMLLGDKTNGAKLLSEYEAALQMVRAAFELPAQTATAVVDANAKLVEARTHARTARTKYEAAKQAARAWFRPGEAQGAAEVVLQVQREHEAADEAVRAAFRAAREAKEAQAPAFQQQMRDAEPLARDAILTQLECLERLIEPMLEAYNYGRTFNIPTPELVNLAPIMVTWVQNLRAAVAAERHGRQWSVGFESSASMVLR